MLELFYYEKWDVRILNFGATLCLKLHPGQQWRHRITNILGDIPLNYYIWSGEPGPPNVFLALLSLKSVILVYVYHITENKGYTLRGFSDGYAP